MEETPTVVYYGSEGSNTHLSLSRNEGRNALKRVFKDPSKLVYVEGGSFEEIGAILEGHPSYVAAIPFSNSDAGMVVKGLSFVLSGRYEILSTYMVDIRMRLFGLPGARLSDIKSIYVNPHALNQCSDYVNGYLHFVTFREVSSTSLGLEKMLEGNDLSFACLANESYVNDDRFVDLGGQCVSNDGGASTRFLLLRRYKENMRFEMDKGHPFLGHYVYRSKAFEGSLSSVHPRSLRIVRVYLEGGKECVRISAVDHSLKDLIVSEAASTCYLSENRRGFFYRYKDVETKGNVNGIAYLEADLDDLAKGRPIRGIYAGLGNSKDGNLELRPITKDEYDVLSSIERGERR